MRLDVIPDARSLLAGADGPAEPEVITPGGTPSRIKVARFHSESGSEPKTTTEPMPRR